MRRFLLLAALLPGAALAQDLVLGQKPPAAAPAEDCQSVTAGTATSYGCINRQQQALVRRHQAALSGSVPNANSAATTLGLYNQAATREQFGANFGKSATPQRPPPPVYSSPLVHH